MLETDKVPDQNLRRVEYTVTDDEISSCLSGITAVLKNHSLGAKATGLMLRMLSEVYLEYQKGVEKIGWGPIQNDDAATARANSLQKLWADWSEAKNIYSQSGLKTSEGSLP